MSDIASGGHSLRQLTIDNPSLILNLDRVLRAISRHHALQRLTLENIQTESLNEQTIRILHGCGELERLGLSITYTTSNLADSDLAELFAHLPRLRGLHLGLGDGSTPCFNLNALLCLQHCPLLEHVGLYVDATVTTGLPKSLDHQHQALRELNFRIGGLMYRESPIASAQAVAGFLSTLSSRSIHVDAMARSKLWAEVGRLTPILWDALDKQRKQLLSGFLVV